MPNTDGLTASSLRRLSKSAGKKNAHAELQIRSDKYMDNAIPNRVQPGTFGPVFDAGVEEGKRQARHATPNRVQRDVILQAILDEFALWNTPPKATVKMPNRGDASELANAIVRALERAT